MRPANVVLIKCAEGEWEGLYRDGRLQSEDHHISLQEALRVLGFNLSVKYASDAWMADRADLPVDLENVVLET